MYLVRGGYRGQLQRIGPRACECITPQCELWYVAGEEEGGFSRLPLVGTRDAFLRPMRALLLIAACSLSSLTLASSVQAQSAHVDVRFGALALTQAGTSHLRPRVALAVGVPLIGPIEASGRVSATAEDVPLLHPAFGASAGLALRPEFRRSPVAPLLEIYGGRTQLNGAQGRVSAWSLDGALGIGLKLSRGASLEARAERHLFFGLPSDAVLADRAWGGSLGLAIAW